MSRSALFICACLLFFSSQTRLSCLPSGVKTTDVVSADLVGMGKEGPDVRKVTVKEKLTEMKARCRGGKLVDRAGKEIRFYRLKGCWGNPPADYLEILEKQRKDLEEMRKHYTVVEMTCNPSGIPMP